MYSTQLDREQRRTSGSTTTKEQLLPLSNLKLRLRLNKNFEDFKFAFNDEELRALLQNEMLLLTVLTNLARCRWLLETTKDLPEYSFFYQFAERTYNALETERHARPSIATGSESTISNFFQGQHSTPDMKSSEWSPIQQPVQKSGSVAKLD